MISMHEFLVATLLIGIGATVTMDLWAIVARLILRFPLTDWAMVGRWVSHFRRGQFKHDSIARAAPVRHELALGWFVHYLTGIAYAALMLLVGGRAWLHEPTPGLALLLGLLMLIAPFFLMQPGMGAGILASRTPKPWLARLRSVLNHVAFGLGMYVSAQLATMLPLVANP